MKRYFIVISLLFSLKNYSSDFIWSEVGGPLDMTGVTPPGQIPGCLAGNSVAISSDGTMVIVGEVGWPGTTDQIYTGRVRAFQLVAGVGNNSGSWVQTGGAIEGEEIFGFFGNSIAVSADGKTLALGEPGWQDQNANGRVLAYNLVSGSWVETGGAFDMTGQNPGDFAGYRIAMNHSGTTIAIGEPGWSGSIANSLSDGYGRVRVYNLVSGAWTVIGGALDMTGQSTGDQAGSSVAISSDGLTVTMGEPGWLGGNTGIGRVRVFNLMSGSWVETGSALDMTGQSTGDQAGFSVAISSDGKTVAMGEPGWPADIDFGRVRVFNLMSGSWVPVGNPLSMIGSNFFDLAGYSVAMSSDGKTVAIGEYGYPGLQDFAVGFNSRVRVFNLINFPTIGNSWVEIGGPVDMVGQNGEVSAENQIQGLSVAISSDGKTVTMGEPAWPYGIENGRVRVFNLFPKSCIFTGFDWAPIGSVGGLDMAGQSSGDAAGSSVAISSNGQVIAMGEPGWSGGSENGRVLIYNLLVGGSLISDSWSGIGSITGQNAGDQAGHSIAMDSGGTTFAVGEPGWGIDRGRVRVFNFSGSTLVATGGDSDMTGLDQFDYAGSAVAISSDGKTVAMGEPGWEFGLNLGRVRAFNLVSGSWVATGGDQDMTGQNQNDQAGHSVAISADGKTIAMGQPGWNVTGGRVRVYNLVSGSWVAIGGALDMTGLYRNDQAGYSIAMNSSGTTVAIGEPGWSGGNEIGRVRVYNLINFPTGSSWVATGGALDMTGQNPGDQAGYSLAISADGKTVTIGEPGWSGENNLGRERVFHLVNGPTRSSWVATGTALAMVGQYSGDAAGSSVAISSDGTTVAMGEPGFQLGNENGRVRTFKYGLVCYSTTGNITPSIIPKLLTFQPTDSSAATLPGGLSDMQLPIRILYLAALQRHPNF